MERGYFNTTGTEYEFALTRGEYAARQAQFAAAEASQAAQHPPAATAQETAVDGLAAVLQYDADDELEGWKVNANCRGTDPTIFYGDEVSIETDRAKAVCADCPVKVDCLEYALGNRDAHGVWGGATEKERRRILRRQRQIGRGRI